MPKRYDRHDVDLWGYMNGTVERPLTGERFSVNYVQQPLEAIRMGKSFIYEFFPSTNGASFDAELFRYMSFYFNDKEARNYNKWQRIAEMLPSVTSIELALNRSLLVAPEVIKIVDGNRWTLSDPNDRESGRAPNRHPTVCIAIYDDVSMLENWDAQPSVKYVPKEDEPFLVYIDNIEFSKYYDPTFRLTLDGCLEGTLYREDNSEDYMVVNMSFGM